MLFGVWGLGKVGKSVVAFLRSEQKQVGVFVDGALTREDRQWLDEQQVILYSSYVAFVASSDFIIPSPGIAEKKVAPLRDKLLTEVDLFFRYCTVPVIAVTGTVGKTTTTHLLVALLRAAGKRAVAIGNVGVSLCSVLTQQEDYDYFVAELSSFQLAFAQQCKPAVAVWTNFSLNHLDWHCSEASYFSAKMGLCLGARQCIIPVAVQRQTEQFLPTISFYLAYNEEELAWCIKQSLPAVYWRNQQVWMWKEGKEKALLTPQAAKQLGKYTFADNIVAAVAGCTALGVSLEQVTGVEKGWESPHRLELFATKGTTNFYNDSKATTPQATLAAVEQLYQQGPLLLILGGLSKGIDRQLLMQVLAEKVTHVVCFGAEAKQLYHYCCTHAISAVAFATLEEVAAYVVHCWPAFVTVLFSPAGSSFDLFANYEQRGEVFKKLVAQLLI